MKRSRFALYSDLVSREAVKQGLCILLRAFPSGCLCCACHGLLQTNREQSIGGLRTNGIVILGSTVWIGAIVYWREIHEAERREGFEFLRCAMVRVTVRKPGLGVTITLGRPHGGMKTA